MGHDTNDQDGDTDGGVLDWSRRNVLKITGVGAGVAALGGANTVAAQEGDGDGTPTETPDEGDDDMQGDGSANQVHTVRTMITGPSTNPQRPADFFYQPTGIHIQPGDVVRFQFVTPDHNVVSYHPAFGMRRRVPVGVDSFSSPIHGWTDDSIADDQIEPPAEMGGGEGEGPPMDGETPGEGETPMGEETPGDEATPTDDETPMDGEGEPAGPVPDTWLHAFDTPGVYDLLCSPHETFGMAMRVVVGDQTEAPFETSNPENLAEPRRGPAGLARQTLTDPALQPANIVSQGQVPWGALESNQSGEQTDTPTEGGGTEGA